MKKIEIDDKYLADLSEYFEEHGKQLQGIVDRYIVIMNKVTTEGVANGASSEAIKTFMSGLEKMGDVISGTSIEIKNNLVNFLAEIDEQDSYLY